MIKAKVVGAAGYGGAGIIDLLLRHPEVKIVSLVDKLDDRRPLSGIFPHLRGLCDLPVQVAGEEMESEVPDVVFMAVPDGVAMCTSRQYLDTGAKVIDFSADFRLKDLAVHNQFYNLDHAAPDLASEAVYGLTELHREEVRSARLVANPGCFVAGCLLGFAPAVTSGLIRTETLIADAKSGVSGAGRKPTPDHHFSARNENMNAYKIVGHRHTPEIEQELSLLAKTPVSLSFTPHVVPITRGIVSTLYGTLTSALSEEEARQVYREFYAGEPFIRVMPDGNSPGTLAVRGSNFCDISVNVDKHTNRLVVVTCLDNLMKGQAGSALQNMNVMFGLEETTALRSPALYP